MSDGHVTGREVAVPKSLVFVETKLERLSNNVQKLSERLESVISASTQPKEQQIEKPIMSAPLAERIMNISEVIDKNSDILQSLLDRLEI